MKKSTFNFYERTILENICFDGYELDTELKTDFDKVQELYKIFSSEYKGRHNQHQEDKTIFVEWLQGLPSSLSVPFYNYDILENAKKEGFNLMTEEAEENFLSSYWINLSNAFFTLKNNL